MSIAAIKVILRALWMWPFLALIFTGLALAGVVHGPWNYYWFFAMGCGAVLDVYWALSARATTPVVPPGQRRLAVLTSVLTQALYYLPLSSVPLLGQQIVPRFASLEIFGASMCAGGVGFAIWARRILAGNWKPAATLQERHALVQTGPYAIVRHPIYFGFLMTWVGMFLVLGEVRALICFWHAEKVLRRMRAEEDILRAAYPDDYPDYERRVKRLLPCIW